MDNTIRIYIRTENSEEYEKAFDILTQLGGKGYIFGTAHCGGWLYINEKGEIKFLCETHLCLHPKKHAMEDGKKYVIYNVYNFPQDIINAHKINIIRRLVTEPIVTQKEYRNTIEILEEVRECYFKSSDKNKIDLASKYTDVINDLKKYVKHNG